MGWLSQKRTESAPSRMLEWKGDGEGRTFAGDVSKGMDVFDEEFGERVVDGRVLP